jgi:hypothetical protein
LIIRPFRKEGLDSAGNKKLVKTNHFKILVVSIILSMATTTIAYMIFP